MEGYPLNNQLFEEREKLNWFIKIGIALALIGGVIGLIGSIWMFSSPPNFPNSGTITDLVEYNGGIYLLLSDYSSFSQGHTYWLLVGCLLLIDSVGIYVLTLALISKKLLNHSNKIAILLIILGIAEMYIFILAWSMPLFSGQLPQLTNIFLMYCVFAGLITVNGGALIFRGLKREKIKGEK